jgi:cytochrome-b5 reductase
MLGSFLRHTSLRKSSRMFSALFAVSFATSATTFCEEKKVALSTEKFTKFKVKSVELLTHNTKRVIFDLPTPEHETGCVTASVLVAKAQIDGKTVVRPYTPTNLNSEKGFLELVVKGYPTGKLSKHIFELQVGDELEMKGPTIKYKYVPNKYKQIGLIAGGSGITPMLQLIKEILRNPEDKTPVVLIFANETEEDIILRDEIDALQYLYSDQFKVYYVLTKPTETWTGYTGYVSKEMIQETLPAPEEGNFIAVCGPPPMMYHISGDKAKDRTQGELQGLLKELNYTYKNVFKY